MMNKNRWGGLSLLFLCLFHVEWSAAFTSPKLGASRIGSHLFPVFVARNNRELMEGGAAPYVPDGMTPEEYTRLRAKETAELAKKNFGAWGPRFHKGARPEGDWFVVPGLWTDGFRAQSRDGDPGPVQSKRMRLRSMLRSYGPSFLLAYIFLDGVIAASAMARVSRFTISSAASIAVKFLVSNTMHASIKANAIKLAMAIVLTVPVEKCMEYTNRRWLWAPRRTIVTSVATIISALFVFGMLSMGLQSFV